MPDLLLSVPSITCRQMALTASFNVEKPEPELCEQNTSSTQNYILTFSNFMLLLGLLNNKFTFLANGRNGNTAGPHYYQAYHDI